MSSRERIRVPSPTPIDPTSVIIVDRLPPSSLQLDEGTSHFLLSSFRRQNLPIEEECIRPWRGEKRIEAVLFTGASDASTRLIGGSSIAEKIEAASFRAPSSLELPPQVLAPSRPQKNRFRALKSGQWFAKYSELARFKEKYGHCHVPHNWKGNVTLAQWVKRQRYQYRLKENGKHSTLTDERQDSLEHLGFVWCSHGAQWEERYEDLKEFTQKHGHCDVPNSYPTNPTLAAWVKSQRRQHKLYLKGEQNSISPERMDKMNSLGFVWDQAA